MGMRSLIYNDMSKARSSLEISGNGVWGCS